MTTYYVSPSGNNSNNGLGPDASHATNKPWLTLAKALTTGSPVVAGDIIYVAPGTYYSAGAMAVLATISSAGTPTQIIGDPDNEQGFKDGSGVRLAAGSPWVTMRTAVEGMDGAVGSTSALMDGSVNNPSGLQFRSLVLETSLTSSNTAIWRFSGNAGTDVIFEDCYLIGYNILKYQTGALTAGRSHAIRRCSILTTNTVWCQTSTAAATADADLNITIEENLLIGAFTSGLDTLQLGASGGNIAGGIRYYHNQVLCGSTVLSTTALRVSTVTPIRVGANKIFSAVSSGGPWSVGTAGQVVSDDRNYYWMPSGSSITNAGHDVINSAPTFVLPHLVKWGISLPRMDFGAFHEAATATQRFGGIGRTTADYRGRTVRPWATGDTTGCWQSLDLRKDALSAMSGGGANSAAVVGAGEFSLFVQVPAAAVTITVKTKSTSYGGTSYPQMIMEASPDAGVSSATATATDATEQTLTIGPFTPTAAGVVELRFISRSTSSASATYFDLLVES